MAAEGLGFARTALRWIVDRGAARLRISPKRSIPGAGTQKHDEDDREKPSGGSISAFATDLFGPIYPSCSTYRQRGNREHPKNSL